MFGQGRFWPILPGLILGGGYYLVVELTVSEAAASLAEEDFALVGEGIRCRPLSKAGVAEARQRVRRRLFNRCC